jgi:hypothetical protein
LLHTPLRHVNQLHRPDIAWRKVGFSPKFPHLKTVARPVGLCNWAALWMTLCLDRDFEPSGDIFLMSRF